jgi:hypothetical protein
MQSEYLLTESELEAAEFRALFDLVLCGTITLEQIPMVHRLANLNVYTAAFRHSRGGWPKGDFSETEAVLAIMESDARHMVPGAYRKWLEEKCRDYKSFFLSYRSH